MSPRPSPQDSPASRAGGAPQQGAQKRAAVRLRLPSLPAEVWTQEAARCRRVTCKLINISEGGVLIEADQELAEGTSLYCRFTLPKGPLVANSALVVRADETPRGHLHLGLRFVGMANARRDLLVRWIFAELASRSR